MRCVQLLRRSTDLLPLIFPSPVAACPHAATSSIYGLPSFHMPLPFDSLQQPHIRGTVIDQLDNKSGLKVVGSFAQFRPTDLPMYSKNPVTLLPTLSSNYITSSLAPSTGVFLGEKLNGQNYFSWSQSVKMFLEGRHQFSFFDKEDSLVPTR